MALQKSQRGHRVTGVDTISALCNPAAVLTGQHEDDMDETQDIYDAMDETLSVARAVCMVLAAASGIGLLILLAVVLP